jgi:hypothetical protein
MQFGAPWGRSVKLATALAVFVLLAVLVISRLDLSGGPESLWVRWMVPGFLLVIFGGVALFNVRGFSIQGRELLIQRLLWQTRFPLDDLRAAYADPLAMKGSMRLAGNGGFLAITGWFRSRKLGWYRAFVTDPDRSVVMEFKERKFVVSPDDPEAFLGALGFPANPTRKPR